MLHKLLKNTSKSVILYLVCCHYSAAGQYLNSIELNAGFGKPLYQVARRTTNDGREIAYGTVWLKTFQIQYSRKVRHRFQLGVVAGMTYDHGIAYTAGRQGSGLSVGLGEAGTELFTIYDFKLYASYNILTHKRIALSGSLGTGVSLFTGNNFVSERVEQVSHNPNTEFKYTYLPSEYSRKPLPLVFVGLTGIYQIRKHFHFSLSPEILLSKKPFIVDKVILERNGIETDLSTPLTASSWQIKVGIAYDW